MNLFNSSSYSRETIIFLKKSVCSIMLLIGIFLLLSQIFYLRNTENLTKLLLISALPIILVLPLILKDQFYYFILDPEISTLDMKVVLLAGLIMCSVPSVSYINVKYANSDIIRLYRVVDKEDKMVHGEGGYLRQCELWIYMHGNIKKLNSIYCKIYYQYNIGDKIPIRIINGLFNIEILFPADQIPT